MKRQMEFVGSNIEKAAKAACKKLKIPRDKLQYKVISYGATGIFGLVSTKKAKIQVPLPAEAEKPKKATEKPKKAFAVPRPKAKATEKAPAEAVSPPTDLAATAPEPLEREKNEEVTSESKALGLNLLQRITSLISENAKISVNENSEGVLFEIECTEAAILIGKRGKTLEAMQYLTEKIINKHNEGRVHVQVDVEGYLDKRKKSLEALAVRMAEKADRSGKTTTIGQMSAYERKIVHLKLKDDSRVRTQSRGDGFLRKLVIIPIGNSNKEKTE